MIPTELTYTNIKPKGWYTHFKQWPIYPCSSNQYWQPSEIIRFLFQVTNGVMDPYRSHISLKATANAADVPVGGLVMDVSAESFISQMVISSNSRQVERISNYDVIAAYLFDMNFSQWVCQNRQWQGMGYDLQQTMRPRNQTINSSSVQFKINNSIPPVDNTGIWGYCEYPTPLAMSPTKAYVNSPTYNIGQLKPPYGTITYPDSSSITGKQYVRMSSDIFAGSIPQHISATNNVWSNFGGQLGQCNLRHQYIPRVFNHSYIERPTGQVLNHPSLEITGTNGTFPISLPQGSTYSTYYLNNRYNEVILGESSGFPTTRTLVTKGFQTPYTPNLFGYTKPYSNAFSRGMNEPMISATIPQCQMTYGQILDSPIPIATKQFTFPLMSSLIGVLIPITQFMMIPLKVLNNLLIELTMNPYAMFSTGCQDINQTDQIGIKKQIPRAFTLSQVKYILHIYQFAQQQMLQYIQSSITKEIVITTSTWTLASQYQLSTGQMVKNNWQINLSCESLAQIVCFFLSNDYLRYTYCRKQFRLSNNITSMQLKFNVDYYPPQPITGNAGNPQIVDATGDNRQFVKQLLISNNYLFATNVPQPKINKYNFAINDRIYDPSNQTTLYDPAMRNNSNYTWTVNSVNGDVAMGQAYFNENRHRGMAAYTYSFEPHNHSKNYMIGVNTQNVRPFDIMFDSAPTNYYTRDQTLYIFARIHTAVVYNKDGITVLGR